MIQDLSVKKTQIDFGHDSIVVKKFQNGILGGVMLDFAGYEDSVILAGHCVITDGNGYKPMPVRGEYYGQMPEGYQYAGVVYRSAKVTEPVSVMFRGVVNKYKAPYPFKADFNVFGIILSGDLDEADPFLDYEVISDVSDIPTENTKDKSIILGGDAVNGYNSNSYFKDIAIQDAEINKTITLKATEKITLDGITLAGGKDSSNGKITYASKELELKNINAKENATLYNAFEGYQSTNDPDYSGVRRVVAENLNIDCPSLTHNIINVYTPADGAEIIVRNSKFNLTVDSSNPLRLANYLNAENVNITFENCDWTYENGLTFNDWGLAGLAIYQPAAGDLALNGDLSKIATWRFIIRNCRYNGEKVTANNFGQHNQVLYFYNVNKSGVVSAPEGVTTVFE